MKEKINKKLYSVDLIGTIKENNYRKKKNGLENFRGYNSGVGTSFTDNLVLN